MGSERSQNAPGERGPAGEARHFHNPRSQRLPRSPARSLGASRGPRGAARGFGICASDTRDRRIFCLPGAVGMRRSVINANTSDGW